MNRIPAGHEIVNSAELATLRRKAQAHDAYLWATKRMADKVRQHGPFIDEFPTSANLNYSAGYSMALRDFAQYVMDAPMEDGR